MRTGRHTDAAEQVADAGSQLRRPRPRARWSLGEKERRARQAVEQALKPSRRTALTIAKEQLAHVREIVGEQTGPLVIDLVKLERSDAAQAATLRMFTDDIMSHRRNATMRDVVFVREEDLDMLAGLLTCSPDGVRPLLKRLDVLAE
jgi:hypothetical protein